MNRSRVVNALAAGALEEASAIIRRGGVVAFPTETVYGLGADATNPVAVARVFELKRRPSFDPLIVHVADPGSARVYGDLDQRHANELIQRFWPGPLTLVVPRKATVPGIVTAGLDTVAIRMPAHETAISLIRSVGSAIAAPSANLFGHVSPTTAAHVCEQLPDVDLILDGGACPVGVESTIIALGGPEPRLLRPGGVSVEEIERVVGPVRLDSSTPEVPLSPGQLSRHYATRTRLEIVEEEDLAAETGPRDNVGVLALKCPRHPGRYAAVEVLSESRDLREAAANLFSSLRRLDQLALDRILAVRVPEEGLGLAIMDRLRRCSAGRD